ncbi:MAG: hypothetical protein ACI4WX_12500, partial [Aristaeellaceae bacterium]
HSAFQEFLNQLNDPLILHRFPQKIQQLFMVSVSKYLLKSSCTAHSYACCCKCFIAELFYNKTGHPATPRS